mmetsp:Transcript_39089/g.98519  ORF Transcript_39089/g.98519 Transcript_39089/m.98519 type:complete len:278 (+) Transcript_39089:62-895(+)
MADHSVSRTVVKLLRYPTGELDQDTNGWVDVSALLRLLPSSGMDELTCMVANQRKERVQLRDNDGRLQIRATPNPRARAACSSTCASSSSSRTAPSKIRVGIDCGGVIMAIDPCVRRSHGGHVARNTNVNTIFSEDFLETPAEDHLFDSVASVVSRFGAENVFIVSKAGSKVSKRSLEWLHHHDFFKRTGFVEENIHFCRDRAGKAPICATLKITHFIDDNIEVLDFLTSLPLVEQLLYFRAEPHASTLAEFVALGPKAVPVQDWRATVRVLPQAQR